MEAQLHAVAALPPPPLPPQPHMLFIDAGEVVANESENGKLDIPEPLRKGRPPGCYRFGRGGRLLMDRCKPFTYEPLDQDDGEELKPVYELTNPYEKYAKAGDVQQALAKLDGTQPNKLKLRLSLGGTGAAAVAAPAGVAQQNGNESAAADAGKTQTPAPEPATTTTKPTRSTSRTRMAN